MSDEPTEGDVEALAASVCPCGAAQHDPNESMECAWALDLTRAVLARVEGSLEWRNVREYGEQGTPYSNGAKHMASKIRAALRGDA